VILTYSHENANRNLLCFLLLPSRKTNLITAMRLQEEPRVILLLKRVFLFAFLHLELVPVFYFSALGNSSCFFALGTSSCFLLFCTWN